MVREQGEAYWREASDGKELVYADGDTCGYHPYMDDYDKDKPCDWCGCRLGVKIIYHYGTKKMFHIACHEWWLVDDFLRET